jgi:cephalosporin-C deacetylase
VPLSFDLSYEELLTYRGTNPRPDDFDEYWDKALAELAGTDPEVEFVPADFKVPFARTEHLYFTGTGGVRVHAKLVRPLTTEGPAPAVLMFHGYGGEQPKWIDMLSYAARGFTVAALDVRHQVAFVDPSAHPNSFYLRHHVVEGLDEGPEHLVYRHVFLDTKRLADIVRGLDEVDPDRVATTGWSQGGGLSLVCAALEPGIKLVATVYPFLTDYQRAWQMSLEKAPYDEITTWFRKRDPRHLREQEIFTSLGYIDVQHLAPRIRARVDLSIGFDDQTCPPSTQYAAYNKITSEKSVRIYPDFGHEDLPGAMDEIYTLIGNAL